MSARIRYYSTNRNLEGVPGIVPFKDLVSFRDALIMGQAPDEGLFMPDRVPRISPGDLGGLKGAPYTSVAMRVVSAFLAQEMDADSLRRIIDDAYTFDVPLESVVGRRYVMRLDQGPTASFKDFAARLMARLMSHFRERGKRLNILVATSGDTGSAVGEAFKGVAGVDVYILYPREEVSGMQKKQLDTIGGNVRTISVTGKFDDCQNLVKQAFSDPSLARLNLTSANSINFGRILPQIIYYVYAYTGLAENGESIVFSVPSGNFGDALGCEYARRMGLPVKTIIMATNENDEFPAYLATGAYKKISPSRACISNAMNVGHPSNLARLFDLYGGTVDRTGNVHRYPDIAEMKRHIFAVSVGDRETRDAMARVYRQYGVVLEPHGAVGWRGLEMYLEKVGDFSLCVSLETAHPAKFPDEVKAATGVTPEMPQSMKEVALRKGEPLLMSGNYEEFRDYLRATLQTEE